MFSCRIIHLDAGYTFYPLSFHSLKMHEESCRQAPNESSESLPWIWQCCLRQGVRQGGILSTELYKVYLDGCLTRLAEVKGGFRIGEICCAAPTCADDVAAISNTLGALQSMVSSTIDYSEMELYLIQPVRLVILLSTLEVSLCQLFLNLCIWEFCGQLIPKSQRSKTISRKLDELFKSHGGWPTG